MNGDQCARLGLKYSFRQLGKALEYLVSLGKKYLANRANRA
jgi:hypothetical protein